MELELELEFIIDVDGVPTVGVPGNDKEDKNEEFVVGSGSEWGPSWGINKPGNFMEEELGLTLRPKIEIVAYLINQNIKKYINKKLTFTFF